MSLRQTDRQTGRKAGRQAVRYIYTRLKITIDERKEIGM